MYLCDIYIHIRTYINLHMHIYIYRYIHIPSPYIHTHMYLSTKTYLYVGQECKPKMAGNGPQLPRELRAAAYGADGPPFAPRQPSRPLSTGRKFGGPYKRSFKGDIGPQNGYIAILTVQRGLKISLGTAGGIEAVMVLTLIFLT